MDTDQDFLLHRAFSESQYNQPIFDPSQPPHGLAFYPSMPPTQLPYRVNGFEYAPPRPMPPPQAWGYDPQQVPYAVPYACYNTPLPGDRAPNPWSTYTWGGNYGTGRWGLQPGDSRMQFAPTPTYSVGFQSPEEQVLAFSLISLPTLKTHQTDSWTQEIFLVIMATRHTRDMRSPTMDATRAVIRTHRLGETVKSIEPTDINTLFTPQRLDTATSQKRSLPKQAPRRPRIDHHSSLPI